MPKKTREQKIRAQQRRLTQFEQVLPTQTDDQATRGQEGATITPLIRLPSLGSQRAASPFPTRPPQQTQAAHTQSLADAKAVRHDMVRILLITALVLGLEVFLYWLLEIQKYHFPLF